MHSISKLRTAQIRYLSAIVLLDPGNKGIRSIEIARFLHVSRPSVHAMVEKLVDGGYASQEYYGLVTLTDTGYQIGSKYAGYYEKLRNESNLDGSALSLLIETVNEE